MPTKTLSHEDYTVGWICPLEVEQIAALVMLDEEHERLPQAPSDHNVYNLGNIGGHNVVIAGLHEAGNNPAATVVTQMRMTFPKLRFGLLVGIGGGVPVKTDSGMIRLGDVVVSKPAGGHSGAVQYDHGKAETSRFKRTGALAPPPAVLLNAAQDLAAKRARIRKDPVVENIRLIDTDIPGLRKYRHPGPAQDHLYRADYNHRDSKVSCEQCPCDPSQRVQRDIDNDEENDDPRVVVHRGTIASGERVIKNGVLRDQLAEENDVLCFEMEAAGALADFPCLVIRGISDYSDSHKNNQWHGYAAAAAAAYARQLFFHMPIDEVKRYISSAMEDSINHLTKQQGDQECLAIAEWLTPIDFSTQQSDFFGQRQEGTGQWLLESDEFQLWAKESKQTLFCPGIPGAGKTMITSIVVENLKAKFEKDADVGIAYVYCNYQPQQKQKSEDLLLSLLKQLVQEQSALPPEVKDLYKRHRSKRTRPRTDEIVRTLQSVAQLYSRVFIIIDALDEHYASNDGSNSFLSEIFSLRVQARVNLFATSRFVSEITLQFEGCMSKKIRAQGDDVLRYINGRMPQLLRSQIVKHPKIQDEIRLEIVKAVDGMFLLARLHMDSLMIQPTLGHIKLALKHLPQGMKGLDETYQQAMKRIEGQEEGYCELAKQVLSWVIHAKRALSTAELQHALAVRAEMADLDSDFLPEVEILGSICAGLITLDERSDVIRLVHYTTREYFERTSWFPNAETDLTATCLTYLSFDIFGPGICQTDEEFEVRLQLNPLYDYAARNWGHHASAASSGVEESIMDLLENEAKLSSCSQALMVSGSYRGYSQMMPRNMTGVHLAAYFGLRELVMNFLKDGHGPNIMDTYSRTPLSWAATQGHEAVVSLLLDWEGVEVDTKDHYDQTPLSNAAEEGHEAVVKLLLDCVAVDRDTRDTTGMTPLAWAATRGHLPVVRLLLAKGADVNASDEDDQTVLSMAVETRNEVIIRLLLEKGGRIPAEDYSGTTALVWAAEQGHWKVAQLLVEKELCDVNARDHFGNTILNRAAADAQGDVVRLLIKKGAKVNAKDTNGKTALWRAATNGYEEMVKLLVEEGAQVDAKDEQGKSVLRWAAENDRGKMLQLLVSQGAAVDTQDNSGRTALRWAAENGREEMVRLLVGHGAAVDAKDNSGRTALRWASENDHGEIVDLLVGQGAAVDAKDNSGRTALRWATENGREEMVRLLVGQGAAVDAKDNSGRTALRWAAESGRGEMVRLLVGQGAAVDAKDNSGQTALRWAAEIGRGEMVRLLVGHGAAVDAKDNSGRTALRWATENGREEMVRLLVGQGAAVDAKDNSGRTALRWAAENDREEMVYLLIGQGAATDVKDNMGRTALLEAVDFGRLNMVRLLLEKGANINIKDERGYLPITRAAKSKNAKIINLLLDNGSQFDPEDSWGGTTLVWASEHGLDTTVDLLIQKGVDVNARDDCKLNDISDPRVALQGLITKAEPPLEEHGMNTNANWDKGSTALHMASRNGHLPVVERLLKDDRVAADATIKGGWTALHLAAEKGHLAVVERLLKDGRVAADAVSIKVYTPLHRSAQYGRLKVVQRLLKDDRVKADAVTEAGWTTLHLAAENGHINVVEWLLKDGRVAADAVLTQGYTPLHIAALQGHLAVVERLLKDGRVAADMKSKEGWTALHLAAENGDLPVVERLLKDGRVASDATTEEGWTALHLASQNGHLTVVERLLKDNRITADAVSSRGYTPLHIASENGHLTIVERLVASGGQLDYTAELGISVLHSAVYGGHEETVQAIIQLGANPLLVDGYGRTCLDWAHLCKPLFQKTRFRYEDYHATSHSVQQSALRRSIRTLSQQLIQVREKRGFNRLGHCLLYLEDFIGASIAFEQDATIESGGTLIKHRTKCDLCAFAIHGERFVCKICYDVDLCGSCVEKYADRVVSRCCQNHTFLTVPGKNWQHTQSPGIDLSRELQDEWLTHIAEQYREL